MKFFFLLVGFYFAIECFAGGHFMLGTVCAVATVMFCLVFYGMDRRPDKGK